MAKKRKLNSKNPKYLSDHKKQEPDILEKRLLNTPNPKIKVYSVFLK